MGEKRTFISAVMGELSRRKVLSTLGAYAVAVFVILQILDAAVEPLRLPDWLPTLVVVVLILGFPVVFVLAWQFDLTGHGIERTRSASLLTRVQSFVLFGFMFLATAGLGLGFYQYYSGLFDNPVGGSSAAVNSRDFSAPENSIAVLPFTDLSEQGNQAHFSDGMAEEILNLLTRVEGLHVAARTSSFAFRNPTQDIRDIGRALNVRTVLEGSIRSSGNRIRLTAQLINVEDGYHIWSQTFDRELTDLFELQDEIASSIAEALVDSFAGLSSRPSSRTTNLAAFEAYRTGRLHWWRRSPQELQKAIELFAKALESDAEFAPAYAAIADSWILLSLYGDVNQVRAIERAMPMVDKALALDPSSAEAFSALGLARMQIGQLDSAESALRQAIKLNDDYIPARLWLANLLGSQGRLPEQGVVLQDAMALDPLNELLAINYAGNLDSRGNYAAARGLLDEQLIMKPGSEQLLLTVAGLALKHGELVTGWEYARRAYDAAPDNPKTIQQLAMVWMELGDLRRSEALLQEAMSLAGDNSGLLSQYYTLLLADTRLEEAEQVVRQVYGDDVQTLPDNFQRYYHFQMGLLRMVGAQLESALTEFEQAISNEDSIKLDNDQLFALTSSAYLHGLLGHPEQAEQRLAQAEALVRRARVNGLDGPELYYTDTVILTLRGQLQQAVAMLRQAYDSGWRQAWVLEMDRRLEPLHGLPAFADLRRQIEDDVNQARAVVLSRQPVAMR